MQDSVIKDGRTDLPIFIHSEVDDYGLTPIEFRVYARLARRCGQEGAKESVVNMAESFGVNRKTIQRCLQLLFKCRMVRMEVRPGYPNVYWLNPSHAWMPKEYLSTLRQQPDPCDIPDPATFQTQVPSVAGGATSQTQGGATLETHKGTPTQGSPRRFSSSTTTARAKPISKMSEGEFIDSLKSNPAYNHIDIETERGKLIAWCSVNGRDPTPRTFVNWLNRIQRPLTQKANDGKSKQQTRTDTNGRGSRQSASQPYNPWADSKAI